MSWLSELLRKADWGDFEPERLALQTWEYYPLLVDSVHNLKREVLFASHVHGEGHIERVLLHGAMLAMRHNCGEHEVALLLDACSYHDTGRVDDSVDNDHGASSAKKLPGLTAWQGDDLRVLQAVIEVHSRRDEEIDEVIKRYHVMQEDRTRKLAMLLKDADGLDRVRLHDLDVRYLRSEVSGEQVGFAEWIYRESREWENQTSQGARESGSFVPAGLREAADHFGVDGVISPLNGGEGKSWCVGNFVFKPMGESQQTDWICEVLTELDAEDFRVPRYKRSQSDKWTHLGWTCCDWLEGEEVRRGSDVAWLEVMWAGCAFQEALTKRKKPDWMGKTYNIYTAGDLIAWEEMPVTLLPAFTPLFAQLIGMANGGNSLRNQLIHGDLSGNVLLHPKLTPGIIDFSPYWRPFLMGPATVVADALLWHQAGESLLGVVSDEFGREILHFVARGLAFRLAISNLALTERGSQDEVVREYQDYQRATKALSQFV